MHVRTIHILIFQFNVVRIRSDKFSNRLICEHKISLNEKELRGTKEKLENTIRKDIQQFENLRFDNMQNEKNKRSEWYQHNFIHHFIK